MFLGSKWFKTLVTCGVAFRFENMFENDYRSVKARNKTCAWVWFCFWKWKPNNLHKKQPTYFRECIACLGKWFVLCLEKVLGTNRIKLGLVGKRWCELLSSAVMTGATRRASANLLGRASQVMNTPGRAPQRVRPVLSDFTRRQLARASSESWKFGFWFLNLVFNFLIPFY